MNECSAPPKIKALRLLFLGMLSLVSCATEDEVPPPFSPQPNQVESDVLTGSREKNSAGNYIPPSYDRRDTPFTNQ